VFSHAAYKDEYKTIIAQNLNKGSKVCESSSPTVDTSPVYVSELLGPARFTLFIVPDFY